MSKCYSWGDAWVLESVKAMFEPLLAVVNLQNLAFLSFIESIFFPIPPDTLLMPLVLQQPEVALWAATVTTLASVLGAAVGYLLGLRGGRPLLMRFVSQARISRVEEWYHRYDMWTIFFAGFTPIPYKVFAVSAGVFNLSLPRFMIASLVGRFARFGLVAWLIAAFGADMVAFVEEHLGLVTMASAGGIFLLWWGWRLVGRRTSRA